MKKLLLTVAIVLALFSVAQTNAQVRVNLNVNIGRPAWGISGVYAGGYYYLPEIDTYYDIDDREFVYFDGGEWAFSHSLPYQYRDYDLYHGYKVVINEPRPYLHCNVYRERYGSYYNNYRRPAYPAYGYERYRREGDEEHFTRGRDWDDRRGRGRGHEEHDEDHDNGHGWGRRGKD